MIDWKHTLIENYEIAVNDPKNTWVCHHKNGILLHKSAKELDEIGLYYNRPPEELIFVTKSEHKTLHNTGVNHPLYGTHRSLETKKKQSKKLKGRTVWNKGLTGCYTNETINQLRNARLGKKDSEETCRKRSNSLKGHPSWSKDKHYYNNGIIQVFDFECPEGFIKGRLKRNKT